MNEDKYFKYSWKYKKEELKFCPKCSNKFSFEDLHIKNEPQLICHKCEFVFYLDPKLVATACILNKEKNKVLLLKRNENPQKGLWAFVGGYVERGEDIFDAVKKEIFEETGLTAQVNKMINIFSHTEDGTIELVFEAFAENEEIKINVESTNGNFFEFKSVPYEDLAFQTTKEILSLYHNKED